MNKNRAKINEEISNVVKGEFAKIDISKVVNEDVKNKMSTIADSVDAEFTRVADNQKAFEMKVEVALDNFSKGFQQIFNLTRSLGMQMDALVRLLNTAAPGLRDSFEKEFTKTVQMVAFLDKLNPPGEYAGKPMMERVGLARDWNAVAENVKIQGSHFGLQAYIREHPDEFTEAEYSGLQAEFNLDSL